MTDFMMRFLIANLFISVIVGLFLLIKKLFRKHLTNRMQYNLWFLLLSLLAIPFISFHFKGVLPISLWDKKLFIVSLDNKNSLANAISTVPNETANWMNDFTSSVSSKTSSTVGFILFLIWIIGMFIMSGLIIKSAFRFRVVQNSALPLQNPEIRRLYHKCLKEMGIKKVLPIYSTAFLKSPIIVGLFKPCIYFPIHLISDYNASDIRYILLHELQHYKHRDALGNYLMIIANIVYWFNPFIWYALQEMRNDREIACDTSVLKMLEEAAYTDYGNTLINFVEKVSLLPFPFTSGVGGSTTQIRKRILNIVNYHPTSFKETLQGILAYVLIAAFLLGLTPALSTHAADQTHYYFSANTQNVSYIDLDEAFNGHNGSFVLYDTDADSWQIYNKDYATMRISPSSTYKIYIALFGLESGIITPEQSTIPWDGKMRELTAWNSNQTLESAMHDSVSWYFDAINQQLGISTIKDYVHRIGYGNQSVKGDESSYWLNSSLKISPIEQVELLKKLYYNELQFYPENVNALKNSICLFSTNNITYYGKTGTEEVNQRNTSGWFIGFLEKDNHPYFFATNIQDDDNITGADAANLTFSILSDLNF